MGEFVYEPGMDDPAATFQPSDMVNCEAGFYLPVDAGVAVLKNTLIVEQATAGFLHTIPTGLIVLDEPTGDPRGRS